MFCRACGQSNADAASLCSKCGVVLAPIAAESSGAAVALRGTPLPPSSAVSNLVVDILLCFVTLGIYNLFWNARQFRALNAFLGEERFQFWKWLLLTIVTLGIYHVYTEYLIGQAIVEIQRGTNRPVMTTMPLICVFVSMFGGSMIADAIQQHEINGFYK